MSVTIPPQYQTLFATSAKEAGIPLSILAGVANQESGFNPTIVSSAGAKGIMQFEPGTAASVGVTNPDDPTQAVPAAANLLASYYKKFGSWSDALAAYNAGPGAVEKYGGVPPYSQTQSYVADILSTSGVNGGSGSGVGGIFGNAKSALSTVGSAATPSSSTSSGSSGTGGLLAKIGGFLLGAALLVVGVIILTKNNAPPVAAAVAETAA